MTDRVAICYHWHRQSMWEGPIPGMGNLVMRCEDCGATAKAAYNTPMPELPPMPVRSDALADLDRRWSERWEAGKDA